MPPEHGTLELVPDLPADGTYAAGTVVTVKTAPAKRYVLDSAWYSVPGRFGQMYPEGMMPAFDVTMIATSGAAPRSSKRRRSPTERDARRRLRQARDSR